MAVSSATETANEWVGEPHTLTVSSVRLPESQFDDGELEYEIEHPPTCNQIDRGGYLDYECDIAYCIDNAGLEFSLRYSGTPITKPGTYRIQGWGNRSYIPWCGYEYDAGIGVMDGWQ